MRYYVISPNSSGGADLYSVKINKNSDGYYNYYDRNKVSGVRNIYKRLSGPLKIISKNQYTNLIAREKSFYLNATITKDVLDNLYVNRNKDNDFYDLDQLSSLMYDFDPKEAVGYLSMTYNLLAYNEHSNGSWTIKRVSCFTKGKSISDAMSKYHYNKTVDYKYTTYLNSNDRSSWSYFKNYEKTGTYGDSGAYAFNLLNAKGVNYNVYNKYNKFSVLSLYQGETGSSYDLNYNESLFIVDNIYSIELNSRVSKFIDTAGLYEIGSIETSTNRGSTYCFYSNDWVAQASGYIYNFSAPLPFLVPQDESLRHNCEDHGADIPESSHEIYAVESNDNNRKVIYERANGTGAVGEATPVEHLKYGTRGVYKDGVATLPYVMIELRGQDTAEGNYKSLSIPANNFVSLTHERNMGDSYNTFQLQMFDKDAQQVESWVLLGFRYITFWYTDFVSTSKRFKGQILDYKTTVAGKGLMLTLTGYTSSVDIYTGKDSIPWSKIVEARSYSFLYWLNAAGEYHGEVRETNGKVKIRDWNPDIDVEPGDDLTPEVPIYNSVEGTLMSLKRFNNFTNKDITLEELNDYGLEQPGRRYCLKAPFSYTEEGKQQTHNYWTTFQYYYRKASESDLEEYAPKIYEWDLNNYGYDLDKTFSDIDVSELTEPRPSNIVILIAAINGWKLNLDYITRTRTVTSIPDQVSQSFIDYIREHLIPISMSDDDKHITQFNLWFDDDGYVHYGPSEFKDAKTLYFNSQEMPDSYPLISYTSSSNGAILMKVDASQSIDSINIYTGDAYNASEINNIADTGELLKTAHVSEEWYTTSMLTLKGGSSTNKNDFISYQNTSVIPSEEDLLKELRYRYGLISKYSYKASIDVYGCSDLTPGQLINVYIYLGDQARSNDSLSALELNYKEGVSGSGITSSYVGNITAHHSSGTYIINKITDTISGGRYISTLEVLKLDSSVFDNMGDLSQLNTYGKWLENGKVDNSDNSSEEQSTLLLGQPLWQQLLDK